MKEDKSYIVKGPQPIDNETHRSKCSLYLIANDDSRPDLKRASKDLYNGNSNFCDLPELPSKERDEQMANMNQFRSK